MPMSAELPVQTPAADRRKQINWAWNDVLNMSGNSVVVAVAALFVVIFVAASVTLPKSTLDTTISGEFWIGPPGLRGAWRSAASPGGVAGIKLADIQAGHESNFVVPHEAVMNLDRFGLAVPPLLPRAELASKFSLGLMKIRTAIVALALPFMVAALADVRSPKVRPLLRDRRESGLFFAKGEAAHSRSPR